VSKGALFSPSRAMWVYDLPRALLPQAPDLLTRERPNTPRKREWQWKRMDLRRPFPN
jgi:hypothetical protein